MKQIQTGITVFYSYAQADSEWRDQLATHLSQFKNDGLIEEWHDQQILAGSNRAQATDQALLSADIILLLISADFFASDVQYYREMQQALERHKRGETRVIPILVRPCDWQHSPFAHLQCLPRNRKPITTWDNQADAFAAIAQELFKIITQYRFPNPPLSSIQRQNRVRLLKLVHTIWVKGLLEDSLHQAAWIDLHLQDQPDALENPWRLQYQEFNHPPRTLPIGTTIVEVYDEANKELLILGEPGSGKTTLLLQLAKTLLDRAGADECQLIPVIFNLSSWTQQHAPLTTWLVEELKTKYQVPQHIGELWVNKGQVLPLLDGFDEVARKDRAECIHAINTYRQKQGLVPLVVCSRTTEYMAQTTRVAIRRAVTIQPLTPQQINEYLEDANGQLKVLQSVLRDDPSFRELARTPLMLSILTLAFHGKSVEDIEKGSSIEAVRSQVLAVYIQRMLQRRGMQTRYTAEQTGYWLTCLAKQMKQHNQTEFYIERLQGSWLPKGLQSQLYPSLAVGVVAFLIDFCIDGILYNFVDGFLIGVFVAVVYILLNGILFGWLGERGSKSRGRQSWLTIFSQLLLNRVGYGLLCGLLVGIFVGFLQGRNAALTNGLINVLYFGLLGKLEKNIQPAETIAWSWESVWRNGMKSLIGGLGAGILIGGITAFPNVFNLKVLLPSLLYGLGVGFVIGLVITLIRGFSASMLDTEKIIKPNQGIWNSLSNSVRLALLSGLASGLVFYVFYSLIIYQVLTVGHVAYFPSNSGLIYGTSDGITVASLIWLINGGIACIQHLVLRVLLWQARCTPWNYAHFLDYASEHILLRKIGGGYIFVHRLLLEYFAALD